MGILSDFFVATDADARAYGRALLVSSPEELASRYHVVQRKGLFPHHLAAVWAALINGDPRECDRALAPIASDNDGDAWLVLLPRAFADVLRSASAERLNAASQAIAREMAEEGWSVSDGADFIAALRDLSGKAGADTQLYMWFSV